MKPASPFDISEIMTAEPVDTRYVLGRWHPDRYRLAGYWLETKVALRALTASGSGPRTKFLILCRARSGSSLLRRMLNAHPDIRCESEVFHDGRLSPKRYLKHLAQKCRQPVFGAKLLSYQMVQVQRISEPNAFLKELEKDGFVFIHLTRHSFWQTLSLYEASRSRVWHSDKGAKRDTALIDIDVDDFIRKLRWNLQLLDYEHHALADTPHIQVNYDTDLLGSDNLARTVGMLFECFGVDNQPVESELKKLLPRDPRQIVRNYEALCTALEAQGYGALIPPAQL